MSKLSTLLGRAEGEVNQLVDGLEAKTGYKSIDVSLLANNHQQVRQAVATIGLDPDDTSGPELYQTLQAKFGKDSELLDKSLGINEPQADDQKLANVQELINMAIGSPEAWVVKAVALKNILRELPPTKVRKRLGYRSIESMFKREDLSVICHLANQVESAAWQTKFNKALAKAGTNAREMRLVKYITSSHLSSVKAEPISGAILIGATNIGRHSILSLCLAVSRELAKISSANPRHLAESVPALRWWQKLEHLATIKNERSVSFNIHDVAHNWANKLSYFEQSGAHAADSIMHNLVDAYSQRTELVTQEAVEQEPQSTTEVGDLARELAEV